MSLRVYNNSFDCNILHDRKFNNKEKDIDTDNENTESK